MDISFIIPIRIESEDRLRNCVSIVSYLLNTVPTGKVYIKEVDSESVFKLEDLKKEYKSWLKKYMIN